MRGKSVTLTDWNAIENLKRYRDSVGELIKLSESMKEETDSSDLETAFIFHTLTNDICRQCPRYRSCIGQDPEETMDEFMSVLNELRMKQHVDGEAGSAAFRKKCIYLSSVVEETSWLYRLLYQNRYWVNQLGRMKQIMKKELAAQYKMLDQCTRHMERYACMDRHRKRRLNRMLFRRGCTVLDGMEGEGMDGCLEVSLDIRLVGARKIAILESSLSSVYERIMTCIRVDEWIPAGRHRLLFTEESNFHVTFGKKHCSKTGEKICGDTFSFVLKNHRRAVMCLSDGMGSGERAYESSSRLIETFESMLMAEISEEDAMELMHSLLALETGRELSTLDVASVSLQTGVVKLMKAGGAATFLCHRDKVERICPESLPLGYPEHTGSGSLHKKLYDGDMIVMLSDGMLAFENIGDQRDTMESILSTIETRNAQAFADRLMSVIPIPEDGYDDDRTVLVAAVWEKGHRI